MLKRGLEAIVRNGDSGNNQSGRLLWKLAPRGEVAEGMDRHMTQRRDLVKIDAETLLVLCPYHGPQPGAEYEPMHPAPCGCVWGRLEGEEDDGLLHALAQECAGRVAESA